MLRFLKHSFFLVFTICLASCLVKYRHNVEAPGTKPQWKYGAGGYMRYDGYGNVAGDLEVGIGEFRKKGSNVIIKLVGAVHIGDKEYYRELQKHLDRYDLVLFEGVKGIGQSIKKIDRRKKRGMYWAMARLIGLTNQWNEINYNRPNFKHCDLTINPKTTKAMDGIRQLQQVFKIMEQIVPLKEELAEILPMRKLEDYLKHNYAIAFTKTKEVKNMGKQLEPMLRSLELYRQKYPSNPYINQLYHQLRQMKESFEKMDKFVLDERNAYVMKMLDQELKRLGNPPKPYTIAIFYGAAHFSDLSKRLKKRGYHLVGKKWLKAWRINSQKGF